MIAKFRPKIKTLVEGRALSMDKILNYKPKYADKSTVWMHCASLGEFEQGRSVIEAIKIKNPETNILLSFFSSSGYEIKKNYSGADFIFYLPSDTFENAKKLIFCLKPNLVIFVKYDFWWILLNTLQKNEIKTVVISGVLRKNHYFFHFLFKPFANILKKINHLFLQNQSSVEVAISKNFSNVSLAGDTRIDRVLSSRSQKISLDRNFENWISGKNSIIYGSVWESDINVIQPFILQRQDLNHIVVPHDISRSNISRIQYKLGVSNCLLSQNNFSSSLIIIDNIGMLSSLYKFSFGVYIGGGFGLGIHNTLEAAVYGVPIWIGPKYQKFKEAVDLIELKSIFTIGNQKELLSSMTKILDDEDKLKQIPLINESYFNESKGATKKIMEYIKQLID